MRDFYGRKVNGPTPLDPRTLGAECDACPLLRFGPPVFGEGPKTSRIAFVAEAPGRTEQAVGRPMVGASGELFEDFLRVCGLNRSDVRITNALLCMPPGSDLDAFEKAAKAEAKTTGAKAKTYRSAVSCCRERLFRELRIERCSATRAETGKPCGRWRLGPKDERCNCLKPRWGGWDDGGLPPQVVIPMGNAALLSLTGLKGISNWRGSPIEL